MEATLTVPEAAALLSVTAKTIRDLIGRGVLRVAKTEPYGVFRRRVYVWKKDIEALKRLQDTHPNKEPNP
jgi:excisionase family DNA binding protein